MAPSLQSLLLGRRSVLLEQSGADGAALRWRVPLAHLNASRHIAVRAPARAGAIEPGTPVTLAVPVSGSMWRFATTVLGGAPGPDAQLLVLAWPATGERIAGRRYARVAAVRPVMVRREGAPPDSGTMCGFTLDVSGTGVQFVTAEELAPGTRVGVVLACGWCSVPLVAEVRWTRDVSAYPEDPLFRVGASIEAISISARQQLASFLHENRALRIDVHS